WVWGEMEKLGIPAMVLFHHEYMHLADKVAERYPGLRLVLDHLGLKSAKGVREAANFATLDNGWRLPGGPTWRPRSRPCRATPTTRPIPSSRCTRTSSACSTPLVRSAPSG